MSGEVRAAQLPSALELAELNLETLYLRDHAGRILASRDPDVRPPRFHLVRTALGNRWSLRHDLSHELARDLGALLSAEPIVADPESHPPALDAIADLLGRYAPPGPTYRGPAFVVPDGAPASGDVELFEVESRSQLDARFAWLRDASLRERPIVVRVVDGAVVSACHCSRRGPRAAAAGVETAEQHRGRGYAAAVTARWAALVRGEGLVPFYGTEWTNRSSRAVAARLQCHRFGEDVHIG